MKRIKKFFIRLLVLVRKKMRAIEARLDEMQPHPVLGGFAILAGAVIFVGGLAMMVLPGPGVLALALGIAFVVVGVKIVRGAYGPDRVKREKDEKHRRLRRKRREKEQQTAAETDAAGNPEPSASSESNMTPESDANAETSAATTSD